MKSRLMGAALIVTCAYSLSGCSQQMYWVQEGKSLRETATDLHDCRIAVQPQGGRQVFTAIELETSCMGSKGYSKSPTPTYEK